MFSTTTILLACTSLGRSSSSAAASALPERIKQQQQHPNYYDHTNNFPNTQSQHPPYSYYYLPQHRIPRPERQVPYPTYHPLSRHLSERQVPYPTYHPLSRHLSRSNNNDNADDDDMDEIEGQGQNRRRQQQQRKRRRKRSNNNNEESHETIQVVTKVLPPNNNSGEEFLHYWTITGRNLILNSTITTTISEGLQSGNNNNLIDTSSAIMITTTTATKDEISDESDKLLMDVEQLLLSSSNNNNSSGGEEGGYNSIDANTLVDTQSSITSSETTTTTSTTMEPNSIYQPIRLRAIFTDDITSGFQYLTDIQRTILLEQIVNPALFAWSKALRVVPVGREEVEKDDNDHDNNNGESSSSGSSSIGGNTDSLVVDKTQLYDGESCGPGLDSGYPSVRVPLEHMTDGIPETDTVIYISVSFMDPKNTNGGGGSGGESDSNDEESSTDTPSLMPSTSPSSPPSETEPNVDTRPICPGTYVASATHCSTDQYDRPVAGILSLCINDVHNFFYNDEEIQRSSMAAMHEIGHILGFNALSMAYFRDPDTGEPLTPRDENGDVPNVEVECTGIAPTTTSMIPLPSEDIIQFQTVRGGIRVVTVVTPTVRRVARNMFGCQSLLGAELQSGEGQETFIQPDHAANNELQLSPGECIGDHWQRILFRKDLMNPVMDDVSYSLYISPLTLAYFKDCGWYDINYDRIAPVSMWGRNAGCNFAQQTCITPSGLVQASNTPFFCTNLVEKVDEESEEGGGNVREAEIHGCDVESSRKAVCSLVEYDEDIPPEFNYFGKAKSLPEGIYGGKDPTLNYCPVFVGYANGRCDDKDAKKYIGVKSFEVFGEDNSRCVMGHVDKRRTSLCLPIACVIQDHSLRIKVDGYWKSCDYSGQVISMWWNPNDYVVCPDPARMCPSFYCPHDCLKEEGGVCDYELGQCMCEEVDSLHSSHVNTTDWLSRGYKQPVMVPCSGSPKPSEVNETFPVPEVERIDLELLPEYYVDNATILLDEPKVFEDKVSRMFSQLSSGEVIGLFASFVGFVLVSMYISTQAVRCYKRRLIRSSIKRARSRMSSLPDVMRSASRPPNENDSFDDSDSQSSSFDRRPPVNNPQKDKMVANLLLQNRLELGNIITSETTEDDNGKKLFSPTMANLSATSLDRIIVNRSELPPLEEGRVLAVVENDRVLAVVDDENQNETRYARSSATSATREHSEISEFTSPLYLDDEEEGGPRTMLRTLRLRRNII